MSFKAAISNEFIKFFKRKEFYFTVLIGLFLGLFDFAEKCVDSYGKDSYKVFSANHQAMIFVGGIAGVLTALFLLPFISSICYSDSYYIEYKNSISKYTIVRLKRSYYFWSKAFVVSISGFFIAILPFLFNQLLCFIAFPIHSSAHYSNWPSYSDVLMYSTKTMLYPIVYLNNPYLVNFIHIFFAGIYGFTTALSSYSISLFINKNRLVANSLIPVIFLCAFFILEILGIGYFALSRYIIADGGFKEILPEYFYYEIIVIIALNLCLISYKSNLIKDEI